MALLFLTRGRVYFESVWEAHLQGLDMQAPGACWPGLLVPSLLCIAFMDL